MDAPPLTAAFIRALAHDLDNVLAGIRGALEIVTSHASEGPCAEFARAALADLSRADALIHDAADYVAPPPIQLHHVEITQLIDYAIQQAQSGAAEGNVTLHVESMAAGNLLADIDQLSRAVAELIENAVEASVAGAIVRLNTERTAADIVVEIDDSGKQPSDARAFEPFYSTKKGHSGLGLAIARRIVEAHGGSLELHPIEGGGTRARICLPH